MEDQTDRLAEVRALRTRGIQCAKKLQNEQAEALYWQAFRLHEKVLGPNDPTIAESLNQIIFFYGIQWRRTEVEPLVERSLTLLRQQRASKHKGVLQTLDSLASHACSLAHYDDAKWYYEQVLKARQELLGPNHPRVAGTLEKYAKMLHGLKREDEAQSLEERAAVIRGRQSRKTEADR
jgi:hypothetical protein